MLKKIVGVGLISLRDKIQNLITRRKTHAEVHTCTSTHICKHKHTHTHTYAWVCAHKCTLIGTHTTHIGMWVYMYTCIYTCTGAHTGIGIHTYMYTHRNNVDKFRIMATF